MEKYWKLDSRIKEINYNNSLKYKKELSEVFEYFDNKITVKDNRWILNFYIEDKNIGMIFLVWNKITFISSWNYFSKKKIKYLWTYMIYKILNEISENELIISEILEEAIWFYKKVSKNFLKEWYIRKYEFRKNNKKLILYK